jgi:glycosyltransferase involved in cell wall biosynthesis
VIPEAVGRIPPRRVARSELGVDEDDLLIACALDGADHRGGAALLLFAMFSGGRYGVCRGCGRATPFDFHAPSVEFVPVRQCPCGAPLRPAKPRGAHLVLHTAPADRHPAEALDLRAVRTWLRLEGSVTIRDGTIDSPAGEAELAGLLAAADLHLLPHDRPDIPRSLVLASIAGTPTVAPAFGALRDYPGAVSVPVRTETASSGRLRAHLDPGGALDALCQLADSAKLRARRGELGRQVGAAHDPTRVYREWTRVVEAVAVRSRRLAARRRHLLGAGRAG